MTTHESEQNARHYGRMMAAFPTTWTLETLGAAIATLDFLLEAVEAPDSKWKAEFRKHWGVLEEVNAFVLDEGRTFFSAEERRVLDNAARELRVLIRSVQRSAE